MQYHFIFSALEGNSIPEMQNIMCEVIGKIFFNRVWGDSWLLIHTHTQGPCFFEGSNSTKRLFLYSVWYVNYRPNRLMVHITCKKCAGKNSRFHDKKPISNSPNYLDGRRYQFLGTLFLDIFLEILPKVYPRSSITQQQRIFQSWAAHSGDLIYCCVEVFFCW